MKKQEIINFGLKLGIEQNNILEVLEKITGLNKNQLFLDEDIEDMYLKEIEDKLSRLVSGEPIEYITNKAEFYGLDFYIDSRVLVPRNDTEIMVDMVLKEKFDILIDVGTGSGCIPISILKNLLIDDSNHLKKCYAIDISSKALEVSKLNIERYNLDEKIEIVQSDLLEELLGQTHRFATTDNIIITANLPYIKNGDFENMDKETIAFEPDLALYGGEKTGFELYEKLIFQIMSTEGFNPLTREMQGSKDLCYSKGRIILFIEIGFDQKQIAIDFFKKQNLNFEIFQDNGGIDRCIKIYF